MDLSPQAREKKNEDQQIGLHKTEQFSHRKGKDQQNETVTY